MFEARVRDPLTGKKQPLEVRDRPQINYRTDIGGFLMDHSQLVDAGCTSYQWIGIEV